MTTPGNLFGHWTRSLHAMLPRLPEVKTIINGQDPLSGGSFSLERFFP
jgi:hypothetical protein